MDQSKDLDFSLLVDGMRPSRFGKAGEPIKLVSTRQPTGAMRLQIVWLAEALRYHSATTMQEKTEIAVAASRIIYYDNGFKIAPKGAMVKSWIEQLDKARQSDSCINFFS